MNEKSIFVFFMFIFSIFGSHALNIEAYCSDMRLANGYYKEWEIRCVNTLNVQKKYEKIATDEANAEANRRAKFENLRNRTDLFMEILGMQKIIDKNNPDVDKVLSIMFKMKQICELTEPSKKLDEPYCQMDRYQEYEDMLKKVGGKK